MSTKFWAPIGAGVIVAAAVGGSYAFTAGNNSDLTAKAAASTPSASAVSPTPSASASATPTPVTSIRTISAKYLPDGATVYQSGTQSGIRYLSYSLPGAANANSIPSSGLTQDNALVVHPATRLIITAIPQQTTLPDFLQADSPDFEQSWIAVNGTKALLTRQVNGLGTVRIDWINPEGIYFTVEVQRLKSPDGVSGFSDDVLANVADGVTAD